MTNSLIGRCNAPQTPPSVHPGPNSYLLYVVLPQFCCASIWLVISLLPNLYKVSFKNAVFCCSNWTFKEKFSPRVIGNRGGSSVGVGACHPGWQCFPQQAIVLRTFSHKNTINPPPNPALDPPLTGNKNC